MLVSRSVAGICAGVAFLLLGWNAVQGGQPGYKTIGVKGGGSIRGVVRLSGAVPDVSVQTGKDDKICGPSVLLSRLTTGRNGGVKNAIVYIQKIEQGKAFDLKKKFMLDQKECRYQPHVMVLPFGSPLEIVNSDPVLHNVHVSELGASRMSVVNIAQPIKGQRSLIQASQIRKPGFFVATCDAGHPWMSAYVMVAEHPYCAVTDADGKFVIDDVPPGEYQLVMWHEGVRVARVATEKGKAVRYEYEDPYVTENQISVEGGRSTRSDFKLELR
jgi:hypothetical protein